MADKEKPTEQPIGKSAEEQHDEVITGRELASAFEHREDVVRMLYGAQDGSVCTWPEGYKPRQALFACLTCSPNDPAAVCLGCSDNCHDGHDLVELYSKRKVRCDCGNKKFGKTKCTLYEEKSATNEYNCYNHNYGGKFCTCKDTFPGETDEVMFQCLMCEDWFHLAHLNVEADSVKWKKIGEEMHTLVCTDCTEKYPFLAQFEHIDEKTCFKTAEELNNSPVGPLALKNEFRKRFCSCSRCQSVLEAADCTYLLDEEDSVEYFEEKNREKAEENTEASVVDELVSIGGRDAAINFLRGFNELKNNLGEFFKAKGEEVITADDVHSFFDKLKRPRLDPDAE